MEISNVDLRLFRVFKTVAEAGGFAQAGIALNIGSSTVSTHMADLENRLGFRLCERGRSGFALTEKGEQVLELARRLFCDLEDCAAGIGTIQGKISGVLNIGLIDFMTSVPEFNIADVIRGFTAKAAEVTLNLQVLPEPDVIKGILNGYLHLGIGPNLPAKAGLRYDPFLQEDLEIYSSPQHPLADKMRKSQVTRQEIESQRFVGSRLEANKGGAKKWSVRGDALGNNLETVAILILSGEYIGFLPNHYARQWLNKGELIAVRPDLYSVRQDLMLVTRNAGARNKALTIFVDLLTKLCVHQ